MPDSGARLSALIVEHLDPAEVERLDRDLGLSQPTKIHADPRLRYEAVTVTREGMVRPRRSAWNALDSLRQFGRDP